MTRAITLTFLAACAIWSASASDSEWNQAARDHILDIHNTYRRDEGGCQVNKLEYDMELEAQAKGWAEACNFEHEMIDGRGENLAYNTNTPGENELITQAAKGWFDEKNDYSPGQYGCQRSCHYTQLVWDTTSKVGCFSTRCPSLGNTNAKNAWYFVCFYTPMGNMMGQDPYKTTCDAPCRDGQTEEDGLCVGEAIIPCVDTKDECSFWAGSGECENNPGFMEKECRKACKICESDEEEEEEEAEKEESTEEGAETGGSTDEGEGGGAEAEQGAETGGNTEEGEGGGAEAEEGPCVDDKYDCIGWAANNQCTVNPDYMLKYCRKSCGVCEGDDAEAAGGECEDKNETCKDWADAGHCKSNAGYMLNNCRKSCGGC